MPALRQLRPVELRPLERLRVLRVGHDRRVPAHPRELLRSAPRRSPGRARGSGCEVKNWNGVDAPHSSPMNSIGVNGPHRVSSSGAGQLVRRRGARSAGRRGRGCRSGRGSGCSTTSRQVGSCVGVDRDAVVALAERRPRAVVEEALLAHLRQRRRAARSRRSSRWSRRSAPRAGRGGSRRSTGRPARSRRPRVG